MQSAKKYFPCWLTIRIVFKLKSKGVLNNGKSKTLKVPIELANALTSSRLDNPAGKVKEALSNALWSITSIPEVALYVTQNFDFLQVIIDTIKQGPDSDSETHTG